MPSDSPAAHKPRIVKPTSAAGRPVYDCRGAVIHSNEKGTIYSFTLDGFPHGLRGYWGGFGHIDVVDLVDAWLDTGRLPAPYVKKG
jgi:hypothetical protein